MIKPKGGRGKKAPYKTVQMRVPVPIKSQLEKLVEDYRTSVLEKAEDIAGEAIEQDKENMNTCLDEAIEKAREILRQKKSARQSMSKLLSEIYGSDVSI